MPINRYDDLVAIGEGIEALDIAALLWREPWHASLDVTVH
jgi:hypothetical protein